MSSAPEHESSTNTNTTPPPNTHPSPEQDVVTSESGLSKTSSTPLQFKSSTIAPSPPPPLQLQGTTSTPSATLGAPSTPLRISTDLDTALSASPTRIELQAADSLSPTRVKHSVDRKTSTNSLAAVSRTPSLKAALVNSVGSTTSGTSSLVPSPIISALGEMTPLPSPLMIGDSPGPWRRLNAASSSPPQRDRLRMVGEGSVLVTSSGESIDAALANAPKRKLYASREPGDNSVPPLAHPQLQQPHARNRSVSEYVPEHVGPAKRPVSVSGSHPRLDSTDTEEPQMRRESNFAESRGLTPTVTQPPTPPASDSSKESTDGSSSKADGSSSEFFQARGRHDQKMRRWKALQTLGQGTFSRVMLATSQLNYHGSRGASVQVDATLSRKSLVAVKVCEHGPKGGASEDRIEMSLKRELEIMKSIHHPSLVDLKAWSIEPSRAILVLTYCPGGDLFDVATTNRKALTPALLRRVFAEVVGAVRYLHECRVVHRDIKLENVLVNLTPAELDDPSKDWESYPFSVTTLTDLGLSRRIADDEKLETRCGSEDYAAPEVIMGQPYDGRATDAWSLGVLLYALLEARLPFDPHPGMTDAHRMRSRTSHRIARVEWRWVEFAGEEGDHEADPAKFEEKGFSGAMEITEGLLKRARTRWSMGKVAEQPWVRDALRIEGGLRFLEEDEAEVVS